MRRGIDTLVQRIRKGLQKLYGRRLRGVYLFGSMSRGDADDESDVDVLVVLAEISDYGLEVGRVTEITSPLSLEHGVTISTVFASQEEWAHGDSLFLRNVRREAVPA
jgi:predicted nucleotidyltransferase